MRKFWKYNIGKLMSEANLWSACPELVEGAKSPLRFGLFLKNFKAAQGRRSPKSG
jgi:hypothetical protein